MCVSFNNMMTFCCNNTAEDAMLAGWGININAFVGVWSLIWWPEGVSRRRKEILREWWPIKVTWNWSDVCWLLALSASLWWWCAVSWYHTIMMIIFCAPQFDADDNVPGDGVWLPVWLCNKVIINQLIIISCEMYIAVDNGIYSRKDRISRERWWAKTRKRRNSSSYCFGGAIAFVLRNP